MRSMEMCVPCTSGLVCVEHFTFAVTQGPPLEDNFAPLMADNGNTTHTHILKARGGPGKEEGSSLRLQVSPRPRPPVKKSFCIVFCA